MKLVNETGQEIWYGIRGSESADCGSIPVNGIADLPGYDNQTNVNITFVPMNDSFVRFAATKTGTGQQVEMLVTAE